jgi:hypothetical protein
MSVSKACDVLNLSQVGLSDLFGVHQGTVYRWVEVPRYVEVYIELHRRHEQLKADIREVLNDQAISDL